MIGAGLVLLTVGASDLIRQYASGRGRFLLGAVVAVLLLILSAGADAVIWVLVAAAVATLWSFGTPRRQGGRAGLWPVMLVAAACLIAVAILGVRDAQGPLGELWPASSPLGAVSFDVAVFMVGAFAFLTESGNVVVRAALRDGAAGDAEAGAQALKGGRLIGPLERILVFALTLTGAFTLLAAVLAAKGIVRFPEISRDTGAGTRAEYFLIGSLVSWVTALGAAFLLWWATAS